MDTTKRFRKILTAGAFAATVLIAAPAMSNAALPGPGDLSVDPCSVVTHGCEPTVPDDKAPVPTDDGSIDDFTSAPDSGPDLGGPDDLTSNPDTDPTDHPTDDPSADSGTSADADPLTDVVVVTPRYNG